MTFLLSHVVVASLAAFATVVTATGPFSPDPDVTLANWLLPPGNRWAFKHTSNLIPHAVLTRGSTHDVAKLPYAKTDHDVGNFVYTARIDPVFEENDETGLDMVSGWTEVNRTFDEMLNLTYTDSIVVMWKGKIIYEKYFDDQTENTRHIIFSCTKSYGGLMASMLADEGLLDPDKMVTDYIPEMNQSAFADATVRQVMDMSADYLYREEYHDPTSEIVAHMVAMSILPKSTNYSGPEDVRQFLTEVQKVADEEHGIKFTYRSSNTDLLGWLIDVALDQGADGSERYFESKLWSQLGQEHDAFIGVDATHFPMWAGAAQVTARDFARFAEMMRNGGVNAEGEQIVPQAVVDDIVAGGSSENVEQFSGSLEGAKGMAMEGWAYRNQYWVKPNNIFTQIGIHGQWAWVDTKSDLVIVKQSSYPTATAWVIDDDVPLAFMALGKHFEGMEEPEIESTAQDVSKNGDTSGARSSIGGYLCGAMVPAVLVSLFVGTFIM